MIDKHVYHYYCIILLIKVCVVVIILRELTKFSYSYITNLPIIYWRLILIMIYNHNMKLILWHMGGSVIILFLYPTGTGVTHICFYLVVLYTILFNTQYRILNNTDYKNANTKQHVCNWHLCNSAPTDVRLCLTQKKIALRVNCLKIERVF